MRVLSGVVYMKKVEDREQSLTWRRLLQHKDTKALSQCNIQETGLHATIADTQLLPQPAATATAALLATRTTQLSNQSATIGYTALSPVSNYELHHH